MEPDRYEWLHAEQARVAREGTGQAFVRYALIAHGKRSLGLILGSLPMVFLIGFLPRRPDGVTQPLPLFAVGFLLFAATLALRKWRKHVSAIERWATWTICGAGVLFCLAALTL